MPNFQVADPRLTAVADLAVYAAELANHACRIMIKSGQVKMSDSDGQRLIALAKSIQQKVATVGQFFGARIPIFNPQDRITPPRS